MKILKQTFFLLISFLSIFIISELFIRTTRLASVLPNEFYEDIGRGRRKNLDYVFFNEGFGIGKFNEYRYIGKPGAPQKNKNTLRCILMGDSNVESFQVFERHYFGVIAENYLKEKYPDKEFEFLNFGRSGFDLADIYTYQKTFADYFDPDYILYMISSGDLVPKYSDPLRPKAVIENDSLQISLDFDPTEIKDFERTKYLLQHSSILNMGANGLKKIRITPIFSILLDKVYLWFLPGNTINTIEADYSKEFEMDPVTERIIKSLDTNRIIIINRGLQELPREFETLCKNQGLMYFDLSDKFISMKERGDDPNEWVITNKTGHWNHKAHTVIGKEIALMISHIIDHGRISDSSTDK